VREGQVGVGKGLTGITSCELNVCPLYQTGTLYTKNEGQRKIKMFSSDNVME
jgi:hypothetical protein